MAAELSWREVPLEGASAHEPGEQIEALAPARLGLGNEPEPEHGNPQLLSVLVLYRSDHEFLLDDVLIRLRQHDAAYDCARVATVAGGWVRRSRSRRSWRR